MRIILAAIVVLLFAGPSHAEQYSYNQGEVARSLWGQSGGHDFRDAPVNSSAPIIIRNDGGGIVSVFQEKVQYYASVGRQIKVVGSCRSSCTLVLAYTNVCVYRSAVFKWHMAYSPIDPNVLHPEVTDEMIYWMPWSIQDRLKKSVSRDYNSGSTMTGAELISIGAARECR